MKRIFAIILALATIIACEPNLDESGGADNPDTENPGGSNPDDPNQPEEDIYVYQVVDVQPLDWSGDYLLMYKGETDFTVFNSYDGEDAGESTCTLTLNDFTANGIPSRIGDPMKTIITKVGDNYSIFVSGVGYIGLNKNEKKLQAQEQQPSVGENGYLWKIALWDAQNGQCQINNVGFPAKKLQWNKSAKMFRCYDSGQEDLALYRRNVSNGEPGNGENPEEPENPGGGDTGNPDPDPDPEEPEIPGGDPLPNNAKYEWYELPVMNVAQTSDGKYITDISDPNLYFAHHLCAGPEKGPNGKTARNYTVCYSAEHHCPVWVAAPRHKMYESGAKRTDAYKKDPNIPADIQYNSKSTGGGCNKGHMLGSAERLSSDATNRQVFYYSNIAPQLSGSFNTGGGGWNTLEDWVDKQVCSDTLYVVIGTYFNEYTDNRGYRYSPKTISFGGRNDVTRPTMFYYILLRTKKGNSGKALSKCSSSELKCAAFVRSHNTPSNIDVDKQEMMSVADLEKLTGFTYFANVPQAPKDSYNPADWGL